VSTPIKVERFRRNDYVGPPIWGFRNPERPISAGDTVWIEHPLNGFSGEPDRDPIHFTVAVDPAFREYTNATPRARFKAVDSHGRFGGYFD
jgi:hypothetical protein